MNREQLRGWHRSMVLSRTLEMYCIQKSGQWYSSLGEEAVIVGAVSQMRPDDMVASHYRGNVTVFWLRGMPLRDVFAVIYNRRTSVTRGRLPGQQSADFKLGVLPWVSNVLAANIAAATGIAFAFKYRQQDRVALTSFGDGTAALGEFHESLNLGSILKVPAVYLCQNNQFAISTSPRKALACESIADWASRYRMPSTRVDGNDVGAVAAAVREAVDRARAGGGPSFVEAVTYRRSGHFASDVKPYRDEAEVRRWEDQDPITRLEARLRQEAGTTPAELASVWAECRREVEEAAAWAEAQPQPVAPDDLGLEEVYERGH